MLSSSAGHMFLEMGFAAIPLGLVLERAFHATKGK